MWWSSCSESTQKTNLQQLFYNVVGYENSNFNSIRLYVAQGNLHEEFKENNLTKVSLLKLLTTENLLVCFY